MNSTIETITNKLLDSYDLEDLTTDAGSAECLLDSEYQNFKYCDPLGGWQHWTGVRWSLDYSALVGEVTELGRRMMSEASTTTNKGDRDTLAKHGSYLLSAKGIRNVIAIAEHDQRVRREPEEFDANPYLLNVLNGTVDLRTGELRNHDKNNLITKLAPVAYDPDAKASTWAAFLEAIIPVPEVRDYLMRLVGYSAYGEVFEHIMLVLYGTGANGKGTFTETINRVLGDYAHKTNKNALMKKQYSSDGPSPDVAQLKGMRFVFASETEQNDRLDSGLIKDITGGDTINARYLHKNPFKFRPSHTIWLSTNHKPQVDDTTYGMKRRLKFIPFTVKIKRDDQDKRLPQKLQTELSGILNWILEGARLYQQEGLDEPDEVKRATGDYFDENDKIMQFLSEMCLTGHSSYSVGKNELHKAYQDWCKEVGLNAESRNKFGLRIKERDQFLEHRDKHGLHWIGIKLLEGEEEEEDLGNVPF